MTEQDKEMEEFNNALKQLLNAPPPQKKKKREEHSETEEFNEEAG